MKIELKTCVNHDTNANGSPRDEHCCGCWHINLDEDAALTPYAKCNECGEIRDAVFPGIDQGHP